MIDPFRRNSRYQFLKCVELLKFIGFFPEFVLSVVVGYDSRHLAVC